MFVGNGVSAGVFVAAIDLVNEGVGLFVTVLVGVGVGVFVSVTVTVGVGVKVGVTVFVAVLVGVGVGKTEYVKSFSKHGILQLGQSGLNKLNCVCKILKLCFTSGADNGDTYILN